MPSLRDIIIERIRREGPITFRDFMEMALYYPGLGYYASQRLPLGREGDFYTSPHLHPAFGAMIARVLMEMWSNMERPEEFYVVEMGGGAGHLCRDIFDYLSTQNTGKGIEQKDAFLSTLRYVIVELNPYIAERQKALLEGYRDRIRWVKHINEITPGIEGCIFSNELLDSFPVHIVVMEDRLREIYIDVKNDRFLEIKQEVNEDNLMKYFRQFSIQLPPDYRTEINLEIRGWLEEMAMILKRGFLFTIDYGYTSDEYYDEERSRGTLLCYYRHRISKDPYEHIGEQDITAHVNFSSLHLWGRELGFRTIGYCPQGIFLVASGIDEIIIELYGDSPDYPFIVTGLKGLILPQGMGETHRVMIQSKGVERPRLRGFSITNHVNRL
jgi:SAM-dependent MidA family methyltransferase